MTNFLATLLENIKTLFSSPLTLLTLLACGILLIAFIKFKSIKFNAQLMARIGLALALAIILDMIKDIYIYENNKIKIVYNFENNSQEWISIRL